MARPTRIPSRRLPDSVRRRLEVSTAMAWEALVETHVGQATEFVMLMEDRLELEDALARYLAELDLDETMAAAIRTRVYVGLEESADADDDPALRLHEQQDATSATAADRPGDESEGWRRFRPDVVMRGVLRRHRQSDETENMIALALARAEEGIVQTHVENAISFTALLSDYVGIGRAVQYYLGAVILSGSRAHSVFQRTMARLADVHLPR